MGVDDYTKKLRKLAKGYPVRILESPSFGQIKDLYGKAKVFWSAGGFGADEKREPKRVEHFGITVVEAMAAGAVPMVFAAGGHKEIVTEGLNGYLWKSQAELLRKIKELIKERGQLKQISAMAKEADHKNTVSP